jgi:hypothetical protein
MYIHVFIIRLYLRDVFLSFSTLDQAPEDRKCWQSAVILIRTTNHKWPYKLSLTIHCKFSQSHHLSLFVTIVLTASISNAVGRIWHTSCVTGKSHQNQKIQRPTRFVASFSNLLFEEFRNTVHCISKIA